MDYYNHPAGKKPWFHITPMPYALNCPLNQRVHVRFLDPHTAARINQEDVYIKICNQIDNPTNPNLPPVFNEEVHNFSFQWKSISDFFIEFASLTPDRWYYISIIFYYLPMRNKATKRVCLQRSIIFRTINKKQFDPSIFFYNPKQRSSSPPTPQQQRQRHQQEDDDEDMDYDDYNPKRRHKRNRHGSPSPSLEPTPPAVAAAAAARPSTPPPPPDTPFLWIQLKDDDDSPPPIQMFFDVPLTYRALHQAINYTFYKQLFNHAYCIHLIYSCGHQPLVSKAQLDKLCSGDLIHIVHIQKNATDTYKCHQEDCDPTAILIEP